jgi:predicted GIY-YIG superfamily endonuclease
MSDVQTITLKGKSGNSYVFNIYDIKSNWAEVAAVYVVTRAVTKPEGGSTHYIIYVGQTDNLKNRFSNHDHQKCFDNNNANRLCVLQQGNEDKRRSIESDLIGSYNPPCNKQL